MADNTMNENLDIIAQSNLEIEYLDGDLNIIQQLDDEPNDVGGLTSQQLKAKFDEGGNLIKRYINEKLIPAILEDDATEAARAAAEAARAEAEASREDTHKGTIAQATNQALLARSYAEGGTGIREGEDTDNARYYMERSRTITGGEFVTAEEMEARLGRLGAADMGAAPEGHKHAAGDVTSGTFAAARLPTVPVSKGGIGKTSLTAGSYLLGNGTGAVIQKTPEEVLSHIGGARETDLTSHKLDDENPHGVTKLQVGLSNVPNVSTNNQTPTYTMASDLAALASGEKMSVAFGKIAKAVSDFMSHASRHKTGGADPITAADVGAIGLGGLIPANADLNSYIENGLYYISAANAAVCANIPDASAGNLAVFRFDNSTYHRTLQIFTRVNTDTTWLWYRKCLSDEWGQWHRIATTDTALMRDGSNVMTGALTIDRSNGTRGKSQFFKHNAGSTDYGTQVRDEDKAGNVAALVIRATEGKALLFPDGNTGREILHTGNLTSNGVAKFETGTYTGTGTNGVTLTFSGKPKFVYVVSQENSFWESVTMGSWGMYGVCRILWAEGMAEEVGPVYDYGNVMRKYTQEGNSLSWSIQNVPQEGSWESARLNDSGEVYSYFAVIG